MFFNQTRRAEGSAMSRVRVNQWNQLECRACRDLSRLFVQEKAHREQGGVSEAFSSSPRQLHTSFRELDNCANEQGCVACQVFRRGLLLEQLTSGADGELLSRDTQGIVQVSLRRNAKSRWLEVEVSGVRLRRAVIVLSTSDGLRTYPRLSPKDGEQLSPQRIARIRSWISTCHQDHSCANYKYSQRNPTWLLHVLPEGQVQLVDGQKHGGEAGGPAKYAALSYCWGSEASIKASGTQAWSRIMRGYTNDVTARQRPFPVTDLPETLRDAVAITHNLGLVHIWIDSVCVPQGHWHTEANRMHEIYGNAHFTLSSSGTTSALDRMLTTQDAWRDTSRGCRLYEPWLLNADMPLDEMRLRSPVAARGWILQEERLSPRVLYWCAQRAYWSCTECQRIEAKQPGGVWQQHDGANARLGHPQGFIKLCRSGDPAALTREWCDIVASYARRSLSDVKVGENRYAAFSGLAVRYLSSSSTPGSRDEYLAGLWRKSIAHNLAWSVTSAVSPDASLQRAAPSWSWLSLPLRTEMSMPAVVEPSSSFKLLTEPQITDGDTDQDIVVNGALCKELSVSGRFRPLIADRLAAKVPWDGIERPNQPGSFDFSLDPALSMYARNATGQTLVYEAHKEEVISQLDYQTADDGAASSPSVEEGHERKIYCLELGLQAMLLLERVDEKDDRFRRVGVSNGYRKDFFEGAATEQLRLV